MGIYFCLLEHGTDCTHIGQEQNFFEKDFQCKPSEIRLWGKQEGGKSYLLRLSSQRDYSTSRYRK